MNVLKEIISELKSFPESQKNVIYFLIGMIFGVLYLFILNYLFL